MKSSKAFKDTIQEYLDKRVANDELFAKKYSNEKKNINDCCNYILNEVQRSGINGYTDDEVYNMVIHYYEEENVEIGKPIQARVVVNHVVELSQEDITEAKEKAMEQEIKKQRESLIKRPSNPNAIKAPVVEQPSLFD